MLHWFLHSANNGGYIGTRTSWPEHDLTARWLKIRFLREEQKLTWEAIGRELGMKANTARKAYEHNPFK